MGKAIRDEDLRLNIIVNGDESQKRIGDLSRQTRDLANANFELRQEQRRLKAEGKENTELYRQNAAEIKKNAAIIKSNLQKIQNMINRNGKDWSVIHPAFQWAQGMNDVCAFRLRYV